MPLISFYTPWKHIKQSFSKAVVRRCSVKKVFLKVSQNSQENFLKTFQATDLFLYPPKTKQKQRFSKAVARRCSVKKVFLKISQNSEEITCARVSFLINLQSGTGIFLWIFLKNTSGGYFWLKFEWLNHQQILKFWTFFTEHLWWLFLDFLMFPGCIEKDLWHEMG